MRKRLLATVLAVVLLLPGAQTFAVGEAGVPSLIIPPGARPNGMGEAFVAIADDATASWWNPAGLAFLPRRNIALMHSQLVPDLATDVYYEYLGYTQELKDIGTMSFGLVYLTYGTSIAMDASGTWLGEFTSWEASLFGSFAMTLAKNLGLGLSLKFIHADYAPERFTADKVNGSGSSFAVDAGVLWKIPSKKINFGLSLVNMGPNIAFVDREQSDPLPFNLRVGVAFFPIQDEISDLLLTFDLEQSLVWLVDNTTDTRRSEIYHIGTEYKYVDLLAGRLGYIYDKDGDFKDYTYGLGFIYKKRLSLDYANVPQAQALDRVHRWSLYFTF
jgi:long-subunit fatty acid transport protein